MSANQRRHFLACLAALTGGTLLLNGCADPNGDMQNLAGDSSVNTGFVPSVNLPDRGIGVSGLQAVWDYLPGALPEWPGAGLLGLDEAANLCLDALPGLKPPPAGLVLYNPAPLTEPVSLEVPLLVNIDGQDAESPAWLNYLRPVGEKALVSINTFEDSGEKSGGWAWRDTLDWFNRPA